MKQTSIRFRLMALMICLTTLPVMTVTWIATVNMRNSIEKEIINANNSRMMWADQYLDELIQQIDSLFYSLQINGQLMDTMGDIDNPDIDVQFKTQNYIRDTLTAAFQANARKVDELTLYIHAERKAFTVNFVNSGMITSIDIRNGVWNRMRSTPVNLYFKQSSNDIYAFHSINRFEDRKLMGGLSVRINRKVWEEVGDILKSEPESSVFLINDEGEMLSGSTVRTDPGELQAQLQSLDLRESGVEFRKMKNYFYFLKRVADGKLTIVKAVPAATITRSTRSTIKAGIFTGGIICGAINPALHSCLFADQQTGYQTCANDEDGANRQF